MSKFSSDLSEQTYRNNFENETFDWFDFNEHLVRKVLNGKFLAIAVDPSFLPKSGKKTPWIGRFWSGVAGEMKRSEPDYPKGKTPEDITSDSCRRILLKRDVRQLSAQGRLPRDKQATQRCGSVLSDPSEANRKERASEVVRWNG